MLTLYFAPETCALASLIALEEAGADYKTVRLNFADGEQRKPDYLAVNPKGRVPALVTQRGILTETPAILAFIAQTFPAARLAPLEDAFAFAQVQSFNSYLCSTVHVAHAHRLRGSRWADDPAAIEAMKKKVPQSVGDCFTLIEGEMFAGPWVMGSDYTICDPYLYTVARWLEGDGVDIARFPKVQDHFRRMEQRPAVQRALSYQLAAAA
ncbi:glutathione S-transferase family protein [Pseudorhodoplanes sp.]|jgi:glutathione S-transferase|uniref:glutathione S-transferase family protein n=1 Tax=Pseudorhodoplanes sp. TaxID=1934341 RepID=UPI002C548094|nr:glutathione S-transferase family protein [Pseudorhodoplanes sp.]HWV40618.1 glutathione S-transferase family protein [Pseudorhodoplanes sp.]